MFEKLMTKLRTMIMPPNPVKRGQQRTYACAAGGRLTSGWATSTTSADTEISSSLRNARQRSRASIRDAAFAKRAKTIVVNNVIGSGIGMQGQVWTTRDVLNQRVNADIEATWENWCEPQNCHTGGRLHFSAMEQFCMGQVFEAGEILIRKHYRPFGDSPVPYALEVIEPERLLDEFQPSAIDPRLRVRMGVEMDSFHRPAAYWIRTIHPGEYQFSTSDIDRIERVSADQIIHLGIIDRWPQTRSIPWMHAVLRKLNDTDGYSEAEIIAARGGASYMGVRTLSSPRAEGAGANGAKEMSLEPGVIEDIYEDEKFEFVNPNRPNSGAETFLRYLLREIAAGIGVSYESLSRDYSQSNYSSSRLALLDDRDLWRIFQMWFIRSLRVPVHRDFVRQAVLSRALASISVESYALDPRKFEMARFKPRGWSWVDPTKEVEAYKEAIRAGLSTRTDVIAQTANGRDVEDIDDERQQELAVAKAKGLKFDTDPEFYGQKKQGPEPGTKNTKEDDNDDAGKNKNNKGK